MSHQTNESFQNEKEIPEQWIGRRITEVARLLKMRLGRARRLLDVGGGQGVIAKYLCNTLAAEEGFVVDNNSAYLEQARQLGLRTLLLDIGREELPFEDGYFDAVFCGEIIEHMGDTDRFLEQVRKVLSPGGCLVLTTPNLASWFNRLALLAGWQPLNTDVSVRYSPGRPSFLYSTCYPEAAIFLTSLFGLLRNCLFCVDLTVCRRYGDLSLICGKLRKEKRNIKVLRSTSGWFFIPVTKSLGVSRA